jgi:hypothetical protein
MFELGVVALEGVSRGSFEDIGEVRELQIETMHH